MREPKNTARLWCALKALTDHLGLAILVKPCKLCDETGKLQDGGVCPKCLGACELFRVDPSACGVCNAGPGEDCDAGLHG